MSFRCSAANCTLYLVDFAAVLCPFHRFQHQLLNTAARCWWHGGSTPAPCPSSPFPRRPRASSTAQDAFKLGWACVSSGRFCHNRSDGFRLSSRTGSGKVGPAFPATRFRFPDAATEDGESTTAQKYHVDEPICCRRGFDYQLLP